MKKSENIKQERLTHTDITQNAELLQANAEVITQEPINVNGQQIPLVSQQAIDSIQEPLEVAAADYQAIAMVKNPQIASAADGYTYALNTEAAVASDVAEQAIVAGEVDILPVAGVAAAGSSFPWAIVAGLGVAAVAGAAAAGGGSSGGEHTAAKSNATTTVEPSTSAVVTESSTSVAATTTDTTVTTTVAAGSSDTSVPVTIHTAENVADQTSSDVVADTVVDTNATTPTESISSDAPVYVETVPIQSTEVSAGVDGSNSSGEAGNVAAEITDTTTSASTSNSTATTSNVTAEDALGTQAVTEETNVSVTSSNETNITAGAAAVAANSSAVSVDANVTADNNVGLTTVSDVQTSTASDNTTNNTTTGGVTSDNNTATASSNSTASTTVVESAQSTATVNNQSNTAAGEAAVVSDTASSSSVVTPVAAVDELTMTTDSTKETTSSESTASTTSSGTDNTATSSNSAENTATSTDAPNTAATTAVESTSTGTVVSDTADSVPVSTPVATDTANATTSSTTASEVVTTSSAAAANTDTSAAAALTSTSTTTLSTEAQYIANHIPSSASYVVVSSLSAAASAVAANSKLTHVLISDGDHFALFSKGNTGGDVTTSWGGSTWGAKFTDGYVPLSAFISNSSSTDVTTAFQNAVNVAAKLGVGVEFPNDGHYTLNGSIKIQGDVTFVHGNDSTISVESVNSMPYALRLGGDVNTHNFELSGLTVDMNGMKNVYAIWGKDVDGANIHDINIIDASFTAIHFRPTSVGAHNITIENSKIDLNWSATDSNNHYYAIEVTNKMAASSYTGSNAIWQQYVETGTVPASLYDVSGIKITGNQISGGYYGISFSGVSNSEISDNLITNNVRNISMQNNSNSNTVSGNYLTGQESSAVHIAYNSDGNTVTKNTVVTDTAYMQAFLQAYQDSDNNTFSGNTIEVLGSALPGWALYSGSDSSGTSFTNNIVSGAVRKTVVGIEAIWDYSSTNAGKVQPAAYMSTAPTDSSGNKIDYNGGVGSVSDITVYNNIIDENYKTASIVYAGADSSNGYDGNQTIVGNINNLTVSHNVVFGTSGTDFTDVLRTHENGASITGLDNSSNSVLNGTHVDSFAGTASKTIFYVDSVSDKLTDVSDTDSDQVYSTVSYTLPEHVENLQLIGSAALNATGNSGNNVLTGNGYDNVLNGGAGNDTLIGGWGHDTLTGGSGADVFLFNSVLRSDSVDKITDFTVGTDKIGLSSVIFGSHEGTDWFAASASAVNSHTVVYQDGNKLFYDADGSGSYFSPIEFAELNTSTPLSVTSFQIL